MASITGLGTTYSLPNYTGILFQLTPHDTPILSAIGGLTGGGQSVSTEFEWETFDLRTAAQPGVLEGAVAPTAQERVRANVTNLTQVYQEKVSVSYSKQAAVGQHAGTNTEAVNPVRNEVDWQVEQMLKQMTRDVEYTIINGAYQKPSDNTTARKSRGLLAAIATNSQIAGSVLPAGLNATTTTGTNLITSTAHALVLNDQVIFDTIVTTTTLTADKVYYVVTPTANTFQVALTPGGSPVTIDATGTANVRKSTATTVDILEALLQSVYDNGGIMENATATVVVNSAGKRALTNAYGNAFGKYYEQSRTVAGINFQTIESNFGTLNVIIDRFMPQHKLMVLSLEQLMPVFLEVPDKGHFFAEPLAKVGASDEVQLYGEVGLAYGNEKAHGVVTGLKV